MMRQGLSRWLVLLAVFFAALMTAPAQAQIGSNNITATLLAESDAPAPGKTVMLAIRMEPRAGWHGYWRNPGDAGVAINLNWTLPEGTTVGALRFPVPEKLVIAGLMNHVFSGEHVMLVPLTVPAGIAPGTVLPLQAEADYLACTDRICVPERARVAVTVKAGNGAVSAERRQQFDRWRARLPQPLGSEGVFAQNGDHIRIAIPLPEAIGIQDPWFFAGTENIAAYAAPQKFSRTATHLIADVKADALGVDAIEGLIATGKGQGFEVRAKRGALAKPGTPIAGNKSETPISLWSALLGAFLGGLILNILPCVFPIISLKALSLSRGGGDETAARQEALAYAAGVVVTCLALGGAILGLRAGGEAVGWAFQLQDPRVILFLLLLVLAITLNLAGLFHLRGFGGGEALAGQGGAAGSFWTGALAAFVATPCTGPFMAAALGAALVLPTGWALAIFGMLGLGLALPFLLIGYIPSLRARLPKPGPWMVRFQRWMAVPMALTALALIWLLWRQSGNLGLGIAAGAAGVLTGIIAFAYRRQAAGVAFAALLAPVVALSVAGGFAIPQNNGSAAPKPLPGTIAFDETKLDALRAKQTVFLYFTADWCVTCKVNEKAAIERAEVEQAFKKGKVAVMVGDWTRGDPAITRFLEGQGRSGVPLYLVYKPGMAAPQALPQLLTPAILVEAVR
jgi:thiol:disulfide interchange protein/DsbC/DsbD-like thiol-disulfide interchange protein